MTKIDMKWMGPALQFQVRTWHYTGNENKYTTYHISASDNHMRQKNQIPFISFNPNLKHVRSLNGQFRHIH
jgi:hypothetical protein